jgi:hypothetical protein
VQGKCLETYRKVEDGIKLRKDFLRTRGKNWVGNGTVEVEVLNLAMTLRPLVSGESNL